MGLDMSSKLDEYIKQIQSFEAQKDTIAASIEEELKLQQERPGWKLVLWTGVAGIQYRVDLDSDEGQDLLDWLEPGTELILKREADNQYDRWAIAVYTPDDGMLGYITRYKNETIARLMDMGYKFHAIVENNIQTNYNVSDSQRTRTENYILPCSIWME